MTDAFLHAKSIVAKLTRAGYIAYFAGGWVRDFVMDHPSEDIDIATNASPPEIMSLFSRTLLVGLAFGVVIVVIEGHQFEVATFRKDLPYLDGRHPQGIEKATPLEDALRRDFTINGMFYDPLEEVMHDFVHGQEDIRLGVICTIGDPHERFFEDRLRMLRAFRFAARFGFYIEAETQEAIKENADKLFPAVAMERIWQEFNKMTAYPSFDQAILSMHNLRLLEVIFPEIAGIHIKELKKIVSAFAYFPSGCPTIYYVRALLISLPLEKKSEIAQRLKVPNKDLKLLEFMEKLDDAILEEERTKHVDLHAWAVLCAHPAWEVAMQAAAARFAGNQWEDFFEKYAQRYKQLAMAIQRMRTGKPLVTAAHLQALGIAPGKQMGQLLKEAERIAVNENLDEAELVLERLRQAPLWGKKVID